MPLAVMCCGCGSLMGQSGEILKMPGGIVDLANLWDHLLRFEGKPVATFATPAEADQAAEAAGWQIKDAKGQNHRCPECVQAAKQAKSSKAKTEPRGALLLMQDGKFVGVAR